MGWLLSTGNTGSDWGHLPADLFYLCKGCSGNTTHIGPHFNHPRRGHTQMGMTLFPRWAMTAEDLTISPDAQISRAMSGFFCDARSELSAPNKKLNNLRLPYIVTGGHAARSRLPYIAPRSASHCRTRSALEYCSFVICESGCARNLIANS